jgi:uncharacterized membrane protein
LFSTLLKNLDARLRLVFSIAIFSLVFILLPSWLPLPTRITVAWDSSVIFFLFSVWLVITGATPQKMYLRAQRQYSNHWVILAIVVAAACVSLLAIGFMFKTKQNSVALLTLHVALAAATIIGSWSIVHTTFALHYAHDYYRYDRHPARSNRPVSLDFPGDEQPDYYDFLYFSFVIGMTFQVSDVQIKTRLVRRLALVHGILSFFFNTVILALSINILAGLI